MARKRYTFEMVKEIVEKVNYKLISEEEDLVNDKGFILTATKIEVWCKNPNHKTKSIRLSHFLEGQRCKQCADDKKKANYEDIKKEFNKEGYTLLTNRYENAHEKLEVICPKGHKYKTDFNNFQQGNRCSKCNNIRRGKNKRLSLDFIRCEMKKEGYVLLSTEYENAHKELETLCPLGHKYKTSWNNFQQGNRCCECSNHKPLSREEMESYYNNFGYKMDDNINYKILNTKTRVSLICPNKHKFKTTYDNFRNNNSRCRKCESNISKGEDIISKILQNYNILFDCQYSFKDCRFYKVLPFDFYLPQYNCCIEFDGQGHYEIINRSKDKDKNFDKFVDRIIRDTIKNKYCRDNNIRLIRIPYWEKDNIEDILKHELNLR